MTSCGGGIRGTCLTVGATRLRSSVFGFTAVAVGFGTQASLLTLLACSCELL